MLTVKSSGWRLKYKSLLKASRRKFDGCTTAVDTEHYPRIIDDLAIRIRITVQINLKSYSCLSIHSQYLIEIRSQCFELWTG